MLKLLIPSISDPSQKFECLHEDLGNTFYCTQYKVKGKTVQSFTEMNKDQQIRFHNDCVALASLDLDLAKAEIRPFGFDDEITTSFKLTEETKP